MPKLDLTLPSLLALLLTACPNLGGDSATGTSSGTSDPDTTATGTTTPPPTTGIELLCEPGQERCADDNTREVCKATGLDWKQEACGGKQKCSEDGANTASCVGPCEVASTMPNSLGCEFLAIRMRSGNGDEDLAEFYDAMIVGNPDEGAASVQLYFTPNGSHQEAPSGDPLVLQPGEAHIFKLDNSTITGFSSIRNGGVYRAKSDVPIIAYLHSPLKNSDSNDSSLLLPLKTLRQDYVVASYPAWVDPKNVDGYGGRPSYFNVIALENGTTIEWTPKRDSAGNGVTVPAVLAGETGMVKLNKLDILQVGASTLTNTDYETQDISGAVIHADKPIWVLGGASCARVPYDSQPGCNHLQEQMIPVEYWGKQYVAAHSPLRTAEKHYWRVYAAEDNVIVTTNPSQPPGTLVLAKKGDYKDMIVKSNTSFTFQGTGAFMPVQYLAGNTEAGKIGDPAMYQTIPVEQFIKRYVFIPGVGYTKNFAQVVRAKGAPDVFINKTKVEGYYLVNGGLVNGVDLRYEIADVPLDVPPDNDPMNPTPPPVFVVESEQEFGLSVLGYTEPGTSAYAYPGGMALRPINPQ